MFRFRLFVRRHVWRGANFITFNAFRMSVTIPFFWRYDAAFQKGYDAGFRDTYKEYAGKASRAEARLQAIEKEVFEMYYLEEITMSRARELLGETSIMPVRERYRQWLERREADA